VFAQKLTIIEKYRCRDCSTQNLALFAV